MYLIVGLGNPGRQYEATRHNMGFDVIDKLVEEYQVPQAGVKFNAMYGKGRIGGQPVILMKPQTYMNLSGEAVGECARFYNIPVSDILVLVDDLDLPVGKIRLREKGSSGGQNGLKNIIAHLGTQDFKRIRIGIGKDPLMLTADYVLGKFPKADRALFEAARDKAASAAIEFIDRPFADVMNKYNQKDA